MDKERRQRRELRELVVLGLCGLVVEVFGATHGAQRPLVTSLGLLLTLGGASAFGGYYWQETRSERR